MPAPEALREQLVDQIVGRVLDHLDLFEDHLLLALDIGRRKRGVEHQIGQHVDRLGQVLVEDLDVVARVLLGGEGVQVAAQAVHFLRNVLSRPAAGALEEHVLDKVGDAAVLKRLVSRASGQPDTDTNRPHVIHRLGDETDTVVEDLADDHLVPGRE